MLAIPIDSQHIDHSPPHNHWTGGMTFVVTIIMTINGDTVCNDFFLPYFGEGNLTSSPYSHYMQMVFAVG